MCKQLSYNYKLETAGIQLTLLLVLDLGLSLRITLGYGVCNKEFNTLLFINFLIIKTIF